MTGGESTDRDLSVPIFLGLWAFALAVAVVIEVYQDGAITVELASLSVLLVDPMFWPVTFGLGLGLILIAVFQYNRSRREVVDELDRQIQEGHLEIPEDVKDRIVDEHGSMLKGYKSFQERFLNDPEFREEVLEVVEEHGGE